MSNHAILSEKLEDNIDAAKWAGEESERIRKGKEITKRLTEKYAVIIKSQMMKEAARKA